MINNYLFAMYKDDLCDKKYNLTKQSKLIIKMYNIPKYKCNARVNSVKYDLICYVMSD